MRNWQCNKHKQASTNWQPSSQVQILFADFIISSIIMLINSLKQPYLADACNPCIADGGLKLEERPPESHWIHGHNENLISDVPGNLGTHSWPWNTQKSEEKLNKAASVLKEQLLPRLLKNPTKATEYLRRTNAQRDKNIDTFYEKRTSRQLFSWSERLHANGDGH